MDANKIFEHPIVELLFPKGNWLFYPLYFMSCFWFMISSYYQIIIINLLHYGNTIKTDTFVAAMQYQTSLRASENILVGCGNLTMVAGWLTLALMTFTIVSLAFDIARAVNNNIKDSSEQ